MERKASPSDISNDEWAVVAPYLTLMTKDAPQRDHRWREVFRGLRGLGGAGAVWRLILHAPPPWYTGYQQSHRWLKAKVFAALVHARRALLLLVAGRNEQPAAAIVDSRTWQATPESGTRAGDDGATRRRGSKVQMAVNPLGHLLTLPVTPAKAQDRRRVAERSFGWTARVRRLARDDEQVTETLAGLPFVAVAILMRKRFVELMA
jgi:transposase